MTRVRAAFDALGLRTRRTVVTLVVLATLAAYMALVDTLDRGRARAKTNVTGLRAASLQMEQHALEIARLREAPKPAVSPRELRSIIETEAKAAGLAQVMRVDASAADEVRVIVSSAAFPDWLAWLARLQSANVRVKSCRVEVRPTGGAVTATVTFVRTL